jgi:hypothetical protein
MVVIALTPPPHRPHGTGFWMGTPAPLAVSAPALALRLSYRLPADGSLPADWREGVGVGLRLASWRRGLAVAVAAATLAAGLAALLIAARGWRSAPAASPAALAALVALGLLASPVAWYHAQLLQLPGLAALTRARVAQRRWAGLAGVLALAAGLGLQTARDAVVGGGSAARFLLYGAVMVALQVVLFGLLVREVRERTEGRPEAVPGRAAGQRPVPDGAAAAGAP